MAHQRFSFIMPASRDVVFDVFHHRAWQAHWDSLVGERRYTDNQSLPIVGMRVRQIGKGWLRLIKLETEFISVQRPERATAKIIKPSFPFKSWAATLQHQTIDATHSSLIYTYQFTCYPKIFRFVLEPIVQQLFDWQTKRRFNQLAQFLEKQASTITAWQKHPEGHVR